MMPNEFVSFYRSHHLVVLPLQPKSKKCIIDGWQKLTAEELLSHFKPDSNIGIRLDGLIAVDIEKPELWPVLTDLSIEAMAQRTWAQRTGKGYHIIFRGETKPFKVDGFAEIRSGSSQYIVVAPSIHPETLKPYEWVSDIERTPIAEIAKDDLERLRRKLEILRRFKRFIEAMTECWKRYHRHSLSVWISGVLFKMGLPLEDAEVVLKAIVYLSHDEEAQDRLRALRDTYEKEHSRVKGWSGLREELIEITGSAEEAEKILVLLPSASKQDTPKEEENKKTKYVLGNEVVDGKLLFELVEHDGKVKLLVYDVESGDFTVHDTFEFDGVTYRPYGDIPFKPPSVPEKIDADATLWRDTMEFIKEYYDNPRSDDVYHVLVSAVAWSYFYRDVRVSTPFILFLGPWRSGKTRGLEIMSSLCYRAMTIVDPSEASIFRLVEELKPTLIIDESQILDKNIRAIMASAYRYGMKVPRVIDPEEDGLDGIRWFDTFSLIIYASREEPPNDIFSRSIIIHCEKNVRPTKKIIDEERARQLRTRWLAQRLRLYNKIKISYNEFASEDGRLQELFSPLIVMAQIFGDSEAVKAVERYGKEMEREIYGMETSSDDALIVEAMIEMVNSSANDAPEYILIKDLTEKLNDGVEKPYYTPEYVGKRLTALGFQKKRIHGGKRAYIIDLDLLNRLADRYRIVLTTV